MNVRVLLFILLLNPLGSLAQVQFDSIPLTRQLVSRNIQSNLGTLTLAGTVDSTGTPYDSLIVEVLREGLLYDRISIPLNYQTNPSAFNLSVEIFAELANYSVNIFGKDDSVVTLERSVSELVAGDVYIIQGQSNAEARMQLGTPDSNASEFIRVFANGTDIPSDLTNNYNWYLGQGDGDKSTNGNTGQWGLKLARMLVDTFQIPIAIFNGANGGKEIALFQAPPNYQSSLTSNYGRLYHRLEMTGLTRKVRAIFWSQGERDANPINATTTIDYRNYFNDLYNSWQLDYNNIEKVYIFQSKNGCGFPVENMMRIKEAQRQVAFNNPNVHIMSTAALTHFTDNCHFVYNHGYEKFATRIFKLVSRDFYGVNYSEIEPPMIQDAYLSNDSTIIVATNASNLSINTIAENFELNDTSGQSITNIQVSAGTIIFSLTGKPDTSATISYLAQMFGAGNFITNQNDLELVCFYKYPIRQSLTTSQNEPGHNSAKIFPNPCQESFNVMINESAGNITYAFQLFSNTGIQISSNEFRSPNFTIKRGSLKSGLYYYQIISSSGNRHCGKILFY